MESRQLNFLHRCPFLVKMVGIILITISFTVLIGSLYEISFLTRMSPYWAPLKINTAICFLFSGFVLLSVCHKNLKVINVVFSTLIILISSATLYEYVSGIDLGIDQLLTKEGILNFDTLYPGRMTVIIAINFIFVGLAFLYQLRKDASGWIIQISAMIIFSLALLSFYNYIFNVNIHYIIEAYASMTITATLLFMLLALGILFIKPDTAIAEMFFRNTTGGYYLRYLLAIIFIVPMLIAIAENKMEKMGLMEENFGDSLMATGTFVILSIVVLIITRKMDREERKLLSAKTENQQNEMIFHQFLNNIDIVFYRTSLDISKIIYVNSAYERIWGRSIESLYENSNEWFDSILPEDQKNVYEEFFVGMSNGNENAYAEFRIKRPDGGIRSILSRGFLLKDENNNPFCITGIAVDMTNIKQEKKYLQNRDDILLIMENEKTINEAAPKILQTVCQMFNWDLGEIWLIDETKSILRLVNNWHIESEKLGQYNKISRAHTYKLGEGLPGMIWQERGPIWIPDYSKRREFSCSFDAEKAGLNGAFGMPIIFQDKIFGIIEFFSYKIQTPDEGMLNQMNNVGKLMGEFINRIYTNDQIQFLSRRDILTGLLNRSALEEDLTNLINDMKLDIIAILIVDIDKFKLINEGLGHDKGDLIILAAAKKIEKLIDQDKTLAARLGADKFILYYFKIQHAEDIIDYAHQIERRFKEPFSIDQRDIFLTVSIGISVYPQDGIDSKTLIANADQALTQAKKDGGNRSVFFTQELPSRALEKLSMHVDLHQAIIKNQFLLNYQPQIDLKTGNICGAEALIRWQHPTKGIISPADFITYAEQTGLIVTLNEHIMRMVFQQVKSGWSGPTISVNISAQQFKDKYHLVEYIESLMNEFSVDPKYIEFEITESLLMEDTQHNIAVIGALLQMGFQFSIDDFGTGFSSFSYLYRIPAHKIKIDKSFVTGLPENQANAEIVKSMIAMLHSLGRIVVAEGAETDAEIEYLKKEQCDIVQGYFYYKPMPADEFITLISKQNKT